MERAQEPNIHGALIATIVLALIFLACLAGITPPPPLPANASSQEFSAGRALATLKQLVGRGAPHPVGSAEDDQVRKGIIDALTALGYQPQVQTAFACDAASHCATVKNVLARLDGSQPGAAVLLAAHYDSVGAGPGASDDGAGVASVLEIARLLKARPRLRHSIILLLDEGEEAGLLGAQAFVDSHPWARQVRAAVNVDARGTSGPSLMFETGAANNWAVRLYAAHAPRPAASSIFYSVYKRLPNNTDFTVFKSAGYQGMNFAFLGNEPAYHTPHDDFENVTPASVQHQGENAFAAVLALANADLITPPEREAVFFDLFGRWLMHWPASRTPLIAILAALLLLGEIGWLLRGEKLARLEIAWGAAEWILVMFSAGALALILVGLVRMGGAEPVNWVAHPLPLEIAFWSLPLIVIVAHGIVFSRRARFWGLWAGVWLWWTLFSLVLAWTMPQVSYVFVIPACAAAVAAIPPAIWRRENAILRWIAAIVPVAVAAAVSFGPLLLLYSALGNRALAPIAVLVALVLSPVAPICGELRDVEGLHGLVFPVAPAVATILAAALATIVPIYSASAPERVNFQYWLDGDSGKAQWIVRPESERLPEPIRLAETTLRRVQKGPFPWDTGGSFEADAPHLDLSAPTLTILDSSVAGNAHSYRVLLRSERAAPFAMVVFPPQAGIESLRVAGEPLQPQTPRIRNFTNGWQAYSCWTMPAAGIEMSFTLPAGKPIEVFVADRSYGFPPEGMFLLKARPFTATASRAGDVLTITRRIQFLP